MKTFRQFLKEGRASISGDLYVKLSKALDAVLSSSRFKTYRELEKHYVDNKIGKDHKMRARWDLYNHITAPKHMDGQSRQELNKFTDNQIDTALKSLTGIK